SERSAEVDRQETIPALIGQLLRRTWTHNPSNIDESVKPAEALDGTCDCPVHGVGRSDITSQIDDRSAGHIDLCRGTGSSVQLTVRKCKPIAVTQKRYTCT